MPETKIDERQHNFNHENSETLNNSLSVGKVMARIAGGMICTLSGLTLGIVEGFNSPTHIALVPGLSAEVKLHMSAETVINSGSAGNVILPAIHQQVPFLGSIAPTISLDQIKISRLADSLKPALLSSPQEVLVHPVEHALKNHLIEDSQKDGLAGLALFGLGLVRLNYRQRQKNNVAILRQRRRQTIDCLRTINPTEETALLLSELELLSDEHSLTTSANQETNRRPLKVIKQIIASAVILGFIVSADGRLTPPKPRSLETVAATVPFDPTLTSDIPILKGARVSSGTILADVLNVALTQVVQTKAEIDDYYKIVVDNINLAFSQWSNNPQNQLWLNDPEYLRIVDKSDLHCSIPFSNVVFPAMVDGFKPDIIFDTGDEDISRGSLPFEPLCIDIQKTGLQAAVTASGHNIVQISALGDDDSVGQTYRLENQLSILGVNGNPYNPIIALDGIHQARVIVKGLDIVSWRDPRQHFTNEPMMVEGQPASSEQQNNALQVAGEKLQKQACVPSDTTTEKPIVLVHVASEAASVLANGCASAVFSGEGRNANTPEMSYNSLTGQNILKYVEDASSGIAYNGFTIYAKVSSAAPTSLLFVNKLSKQVEGFAKLSIAVDGSVSLSNIETLSSLTDNAQQLPSN